MVDNFLERVEPATSTEYGHAMGTLLMLCHALLIKNLGARDAALTLRALREVLQEAGMDAQPLPGETGAPT